MSEIVDFCAGGKVLVPNTGDLEQHVTIQGDLLSGASASAAYIKQSRAGTVSDLRVLVLAHTRGPTTVTVVKTGTMPIPPLRVSFDNDDTFPGLFENMSVSMSFSAGDELRFLIDFEDEDEQEGNSTTLSYISAKIVFGT